MMESQLPHHAPTQHYIAPSSMKILKSNYLDRQILRIDADARFPGPQQRPCLCGGRHGGSKIPRSLTAWTKSKPYAGWCGTRELTTPGDPIRLLHVFPSNSLAA